MLIEKEIEEKVAALFSDFNLIGDCQLVCARQTSEKGDVFVDDDGVKSIITITSQMRQHTSFSLPMLDIPITIKLVTRIEVDPSATHHEKIIEFFLDKLSHLHKFTNEISCLDCSKFMAGELYINGGTGRAIDTKNNLFIDTINFSIRGSEIFIN